MEWLQTIVVIVSVGGIVIYVNRQTNKRIDDFRNDVDRRFVEIRADIRLILNKLIPERKNKD